MISVGMAASGRMASRWLIALSLSSRACASEYTWDSENPPESCNAVELSAHDEGPWPCTEADCPAALVTCEMLSEYCDSTFADVWETPPTGLGSAHISGHCRRSCGRPGFNASSIDAAIDLRYLHGPISPTEAASLISFCDSTPQRWKQSMTRAADTERDDAEAHQGRTSESCFLLFSQFYVYTPS